MNDRRYARVKELFLAASELPLEERTAYLDSQTNADASLRAEVLEMLSVAEEQASFLDASRHEMLAAASSDSDEGSSAVLERLEKHGGEESRYQVLGEFARGGMGAILRVWDRDLRRTLAMKVVLGQAGEASRDGTPSVDEKTLGRFLDEAQVTGQLDHPGIVPVHELGLDAQRQVYFTMKLVKGRDLKAILELVQTGAEDWTQTRALGVILKVCEAMAYAHSKGVIHRDLKPANIMVGRFGEVYVMDWGLAHVAGQEDKKDLRLRPQELDTLPVRTDRREESAADSPLLTMDGDIVGTPAFMSPEQARGAVSEMGPPSDVYAVGAILYQLLAGHMPYVPADARLNAYAVWALAQQGAPTPIAQLAPRAPGELVAICEKAMRRDPAERYADMGAMAEDLRAFLEGRVVKAHRTGVLVELQKWISRNKILTAAVLVALLAALSSLAVTSYERSRSRLVQRVSDRLTSMAQQYSHVPGGEAISYEKLAERLWPPHPEKIEELESWLTSALALVDHLPQHRARLAQLSGLEQIPSAETWERDVLAGLIEGMERLDSGLLAEDSVLPDYGWSVPKRLHFAERLLDEMAEGGEWDEPWIEAIADIRDHPAYSGLRLTKQWGLVPIGKDPRSGLWEFWHVASGAQPVRSGGRLQLTRETGIVLVLIPRGRFSMGAQATDPDGEHYDKDSEDMRPPPEFPVHEVTVEAFFLSKYEMTQGQWLRIQGENPSMDAGSPGTSPKRPVNMVSPLESDQATARLGLTLPHERQWEYAARAGTDTVWWTGDDASSLVGKERFWDGVPMEQKDLLALESDEVGQNAPNPWGLHDVHGNLVEWCSNAPYDYAPGGSGPDPKLGLRSARGGCFRLPASQTRSAFRLNNPETTRMPFTGLRPAREIDQKYGS